LALFGRRTHQRAESLVMPATENLHTRYILHRRKNGGLFGAAELDPPRWR